MLGSVRPKSAWKWAAAGKHPVAMDYFRLGDVGPLAQAFAAWIENGYQKVLSTNRDRAALHSWRFWARGLRKGHIACGVGRDSSDRSGRPYPLLIMGAGTLPGWEENWDLLSFLFEEIWGQIEHLASRGFTDLNQLEAEIRQLRMPTEDWSACAGRRVSNDALDHEPATDCYAPISRKVDQAAETLVRQNECYVSINANQCEDASLLAGYWDGALKSRTHLIPNAVFIGGIPEQSYLAIYTRSLNSSDFARLWSVPIGGQIQG
jgi:type VI secretion system protein VasJ